MDLSASNSPQPETTSPGQTVVHHADVQSEYVAFRDVHVTHASSASDFSKVIWDPTAETTYPEPTCTKAALERLQLTPVLILHTDSRFDTGSFMHHVAKRFIQEYTPKTELFDYTRPGEEKNLLPKIRSVAENSLLLFEHLHPQHIQYDLNRLHTLAQAQQIRVCITTEATDRAWGIAASNLRTSWFEIPMQNLYSSEVLCQALVHRLNTHRSNIPYLANLPTEIQADTELAEGTTAQKTAAQLENPEQIDLLTQNLIGSEKLPTNEQWEQSIQQCTDESEPLVVKWFRSLPARQKLIALGASLLDGVYDDQFFRIMHDIAEINWQYRDNSLLALDYCDLDFLWSYFEYDLRNEEKCVLRSRYADQRTQLVMSAWGTYRRHILAALPVVIDTARNTIFEEEQDWEKYGTVQRRMAIRQAVGNAISDIGLISFSTIEHALLEFAAVQNITLQRVTAKALARWRTFEQHDLLFDTLTDWSKSERVQKTVAAFLRNDKIRSINRSSKHKATSYIQATSVLTLGYAAGYDPPGELDPRIVKLLRDLAAHGDDLVIGRMQETLPNILHHHLASLSETIAEEFAGMEALHEAVGQGLAKAYADYPEQVSQVLNQWMEACLEDVSEENRRKKFTHRDQVLATILAAYRHMLREDGEGSTWKDTIWKNVSMLVAREGRATVREEIAETLVQLTRLNYFDAIARVVPLLPSKDHWLAYSLVYKFTQAYVEERLEWSDEAPLTLHLEEVDLRLPSWRQRTERPKTALEEGMHAWLSQDILVLKQVATHALLQCAKLIDYPEHLILHRWRVQQQIERESGLNKTIPVTTPPPTPTKQLLPFRLSLFRQFILFLLCLGDSHAALNRKRIQALYEVTERSKVPAAPRELLMDDWLRNPFPQSAMYARRIRFLRKMPF
ncbi:MAG: hypothetical protein F6K11_01190 [Leptolyngbya sp. SIO3F4]|nr:hypothetical protein [Leptolyngbya sp. SIO3F4]